MRKLRCHHCGSADLVLLETRYEHAEYDGGLLVNDEGDLEARGEAFYTAGDVQDRLTRIKCDSCGRSWHPRRPFAGMRAAP